MDLCALCMSAVKYLHQQEKFYRVDYGIFLVTNVVSHFKTGEPRLSVVSGQIRSSVNTGFNSFAKNLVTYFSRKPSFEQTFKCFEVSFDYLYTINFT